MKNDRHKSFYSIQSQTKYIDIRANRKNPSQAQYTNQWLCATRDTQVGQVQRRFTKMLESFFLFFFENQDARKFAENNQETARNFIEQKGKRHNNNQNSLENT